MKAVLCQKCCKWVDCNKEGKEINGFCIAEPLFTYTARVHCNDYEKGEPITEEEFENW
jgi:hypothetical protein